MDIELITLYVVIGCGIVIASYIVLRLFAFSFFRSYFQAKSEFLTLLKKKKEEKNGK